MNETGSMQEPLHERARPMTRLASPRSLRGLIVSIALSLLVGLASAEEATSCANRCGDTAPAGCSCELDCAHEGNCCPDVESECWVGIPEPDRRGFHRVITIEPVSAIGTPNSGEETGTTFLAVDQWEHGGMSGHPVMVGLTRVAVRDVDDNQESSTCDVACEQTYGDEWWNKVCNLKAMSEFWGDGDDQDNFAECSAAGIRFPRWARTTGPEAWFGDVKVVAKCEELTQFFFYRGVPGYCSGPGCENTQACLGGTRDNYIPVLQGVKIHEADSHDDGDVGCSIDWAGGSCGWRLTAHADDDAGAGCMGQVMRTNSPMATYGPYNASIACGNQSNDACGKVQYKPKRYRARQEVPMKAQANHMCFLSRNQAINVDDGSERAVCEIVSKNGLWTLRAETSGWDNDLDAGIQCSAYCAKIHPEGFPGEPAATRDVLGGTMSLLQSGEYDAPVVFVEGFDPTNKMAESRYWRDAAGLLNRMRDVGMDVWFLDLSDAGQDVRRSAMEVALAVYRASVYDSGFGNGKPVSVIGVSMGALATRIAMTSWEDGVYTDEEHPARDFFDGQEWVDQNIWEISNDVYDRNPPVSIALSLVGPQYGANIAKSVQLMVQDFGDYQDLGESWTALNNAAAVNMLHSRIHPKCDGKVSQWCDAPWILSDLFAAHGDWTFREVDEIRIHGESVKINSNWSSCSSDTEGCVRYPLIPGSAGGTDFFGNPIPCQEYATPHEAFYAEVNSRGVQGNGFPRNVFMIGLSSSGFSPQGGENFADDYCADLDGYEDENDCLDYPTPLEGCHDQLSCLTYDANLIGDVRMQYPGAGVWGAHFCSRDTQVLAFLAEPDVQPGDLTERSLSDLAVPAPKNMQLPIRQLIPMQFIPTDSALACPNAESMVECLAANNIGGPADEPIRFRKIYPRLDDANAIHGHVDDAQAAWILAYLWEGTVGDGDGNIGPAGDGNPGTNPFYQSFMGQADPDDTDPTVFAGAPEICDGVDNDADGVIDGVDEDGVITWTIGTGEDCDGEDGDECFEGYLVCDGSGPAYCNDETGTVLESCNSEDDDCDGDVDEGFNVGGGCAGEGLGVCRDYGHYQCLGDGSGTECAIDDPGGEPSPETCNGLDDDCDGPRDEDENGEVLTVGCTYHGSSCNVASVRICNGYDGYGACEKPREICNDGIDNDCDGDVDGEDGECHCFPAGTPVTLEDGTQRAIEQLEIGDRVLSYDLDDQVLDVGVVSRVYVHPDSEGMIVINGTLRATPNHPFYADGRWVRADELQLGDTLLVKDPVLALRQNEAGQDAAGYQVAGNCVAGPAAPSSAAGCARAGYRVAPGAAGSGNPWIREVLVTRLELHANNRETTYNIEVEGQHNYFAGGVLVHNKGTNQKPQEAIGDELP